MNPPFRHTLSPEFKRAWLAYMAANRRAAEADYGRTDVRLCYCGRRIGPTTTACTECRSAQEGK